jgi:hypothetical protein
MILLQNPLTLDLQSSRESLFRESYEKASRLLARLHVYIKINLTVMETATINADLC